MLPRLSNPSQPLSPGPLRPRKLTPFSGEFMPNPPRFDASSPLVSALKSFGTLVVPTPGVGVAKMERRRPPELPKSGNCQNSKPPIEDGCSHQTPRLPEARYAYYRRCHQFRRNGEQCKAPALKGEHICYRHAEQAGVERRRQQQRRELLAKPGAGFGSFRAIQRTISEVAGAIFAGAVDPKTARRLILDIQTAIGLQKIAAHARRYVSTKGDNGERMSTTSQSAGVLSFEQARSSVLEYCRQIAPPASEEVPLLRSLGRVLAGPVKADRDFPPFPRATRDGYSARSGDLKTVPATLRVLGQVKAGGSFDRPVAAGEAVEMITGAAGPEGGGGVVMVEYTASRNPAGRV